MPHRPHRAMTTRPETNLPSSPGRRNSPVTGGWKSSLPVAHRAAGDSYPLHEGPERRRMCHGSHSPRRPMDGTGFTRHPVVHTSNRERRHAAFAMRKVPTLQASAPLTVFRPIERPLRAGMEGGDCGRSPRAPHSTRRPPPRPPSGPFDLTEKKHNGENSCTKWEGTTPPPLPSQPPSGRRCDARTPPPPPPRIFDNRRRRGGVETTTTIDYTSGP